MERKTNLPPSRLISTLNALPCPDDCPIGKGAIQIITDKEGTHASCYECKMKVDVGSVKVVYEASQSTKQKEHGGQQPLIQD